MNEKENNERFELAQMLGFEEYFLKKPIGEKQSVKIRCLAVMDYPDFMANLEDEPTVVSIFTGLPYDEIAQLHPADHAHIIERGYELNLDPFTGWLKRRKKIAAILDVDRPAK